VLQCCSVCCSMLQRVLQCAFSCVNHAFSYDIRRSRILDVCGGPVTHELVKSHVIQNESAHMYLSHMNESYGMHG